VGTPIWEIAGWHSLSHRSAPEGAVTLGVLDRTYPWRVRITVLSGGVGGARFIRGLLASSAEADVTVVANTADDIWLFGLKICPDLDSIMYTLGGGIDEARGWGRADETWNARTELAGYDVEPGWFGLGDRDLATHLVRTQLTNAGYPLSAATEALCARWKPGVRLLPMTDDRVETHVVIADPDAPDGRRAIHFQEYWVRLRAGVPALAVEPRGADAAAAGPGVVDAINTAEVVLIAPSNPVVSIGTILAVGDVAAAVRTTRAPVVGLSPIIGPGPVHGMADAMLAAIGVEVSAAAVARHYGARSRGGVLDGWLLDDSDSAQVESVLSAGITARAVPLLMTDTATAAAMAQAAVDLALEVR
jgi:LPPG:FO 2-phospho-L-lactate transferase